ncbi:Thioesterase/thiol ester dehydrase-isomerase [Gonapodya prolifera JEL478]|uniref:Thioesterase/thiol ester dehydrase-isomerase n=1 Tax=Gonapodya prolifera (strain JEL478) TaxID=1344416 RepID=A0A139A711_GONPJ|nr:Thioesterase/thiol ester dehydrase-isomerase [Gonapodya prolifera JEL478]|eukprot:KXS12504.1 Thioesterase/thiol ester dehydrase-isomerase [Gonapodya prolifera JEL478]
MPAPPESESSTTPTTNTEPAKPAEPATSDRSRRIEEGGTRIALGLGFAALVTGVAWGLPNAPFSLSSIAAAAPIDRLQTWTTNLRVGAQETTEQGLAGLGFSTQQQQEDVCGCSRFQRYVAFGLMVAGGVFFLFVALLTLPMILLSPGKFAFSFSFGTILLLMSPAVLRGPRTHLQHMASPDRLPFTAALMGSWATLTLVWYVLSYFPGGSEAIPSRVRCELVVTKEVANKCDTIHGWAIASLVDIIGSTAIATHGPNYQSHVSVDLNVSYLKAAPLNPKVHIEGTCDRLGRTLAFTTTTVKMDDLVAVVRHTKFIMQPQAVYKEARGHGESKSRHGHAGSGGGKE